MKGVLEAANRAPVSYIVLLAYITLGFVTESTAARTQEASVYMVKGWMLGAAVQQGEFWRLLTHAFLHGGLLHLLFNSYFLLMLGPILEQALGSLRFALLYTVAAIGGAVFAGLWTPPTVPMVGGSGALFGMMGAALALNMRAGRHLLDFWSSVGSRQLVMLIVANLAIGWLLPMVSNSAHIGGLIAGFAVVFWFLRPAREGPDRAVRAAWLAAFCGLVFACLRPVTRFDYLDGARVHAFRTGDLESATAFDRAFERSYADYRGR